MGIFGNKAKPSKAGNYSFAWPQSAGLGPGFHKEYLVYTTERRLSEPIPSEDIQSIAASKQVLDQVGLGSELLLATGPIDLRALDEPAGSEFAASGVITDRSTVFWWQGRRGYADEYVVLPHQNLQPASPSGFGYHFVWTQGGANDLPPVAPDMLRRIDHPGFAVTPHFSKDGHENRRGASVQATLKFVRGDT